MIVAAVPVTAIILTLLVKFRSSATKQIRFGLGMLIGINELVWYIYVINRGWVIFPYGLPLDLCDIVLWLTVFTLFTLKPWSFDLIYYWALIGTSMAVLTPDFDAPFPSYVAIKFMVSHGGVVSAILFLLWSGQIKPQRNSFWKALVGVNLYALIVGIFNWIFNTNYFYLCQKPVSGSLLDYLGDWPHYIFAGEIIAVVTFTLLWLPYKRRIA
jgi:hypothetical integral membrane protein (TIGR02206 family)